MPHNATPFASALVFMSYLPLAHAAPSDPVSCSDTWPVPYYQETGNSTKKLGYVDGYKVEVETSADPIHDSSTILKTVEDCFNGFWRRLGTANGTRVKQPFAATQTSETFHSDVMAYSFDVHGALEATTHVVSQKIRRANANGTMTYCGISNDLTTTGSENSSFTSRFFVSRLTGQVEASYTQNIVRDRFSSHSAFSLAGTESYTGRYDETTNFTLPGDQVIRREVEASYEQDYWKARDYDTDVQVKPDWQNYGGAKGQFLNVANERATAFAGVDGTTDMTQLYDMYPVSECEVTSDAPEI